MKNHLQKGKTFEITSAGAVAAGDFILQGSMFGVAKGSASGAGVLVECLTGEVFTLPKTTGTAWTKGLKLYWDAGTGKATTTSNTGANTAIGVAWVDAASGDATGSVRLNESF